MPSREIDFALIHLDVSELPPEQQSSVLDNVWTWDEIVPGSGRAILTGFPSDYPQWIYPEKGGMRYDYTADHSVWTGAFRLGGQRKRLGMSVLPDVSMERRYYENGAWPPQLNRDGTVAYPAYPGSWADLHRINNLDSLYTADGDRRRNSEGNSGGIYLSPDGDAIVGQLVGMPLDWHGYPTLKGYYDRLRELNEDIDAVSQRIESKFAEIQIARQLYTGERRARAEQEIYLRIAELRAERKALRSEHKRLHANALHTNRIHVVNDATAIRDAIDEILTSPQGQAAIRRILADVPPLPSPPRSRALTPTENAQLR